MKWICEFPGYWVLRGERWVLMCSLKIANRSDLVWHWYISERGKGLTPSDGRSRLLKDAKAAAEKAAEELT